MPLVGYVGRERCDPMLRSLELIKRNDVVRLSVQRVLLKASRTWSAAFVHFPTSTDRSEPGLSKFDVRAKETRKTAPGRSI
jgi:hypothetical protein